MDSSNKKEPQPTTIGRETIGRYELIYPVGHGGMASVHVGRLSSLAGFEKLVAIKVIHPHLSGSPEFVDMFLDEARLAAGIHHPNVGEMYEVGEEDGLFFMVGEFVNGQSLHNFYKRSWELGVNIPFTLTASIMAKACHGLNAAHNIKSKSGECLNLVHRDVSPRNILLSYSGFVKLIDFGVAWAKERSSHTGVGIVKGKPGYMSPEQLRAEPLDRRSDIFSIGITFYQMLTGMHPFPGATDLERMYKVLRGTYKYPSIVDPDFPAKLERVIVKALAPNPADRYSTAADMAQDLEEYLRTENCDDGHAPLAKLMQDFFEEEHLDHDTQLREYRKGRKVGGDGPLVSPLLRTGEHPQAGRGRLRAFFKTLPMLRWLILGSGSAAVFITVVLMLGRNLDREAPADRADEEIAFPIALPSEQIEEKQAGDAPEPQDSPEPEENYVEPQDSAETAGSVETYRTITLDVTPESTTIVLDGKPLAHGTRKIQLPADGKTHTLLFSSRGYRSLTKKLMADRDKVLSVRLKPLLPQRPYKPAQRKNTKPSNMKLKSSPY